MTDAFDSDVLIYAAADGNELGDRIVRLLDQNLGAVGSLMLLPEVLGKPLRLGRFDEAAFLTSLLARLELFDVDRRTAELATELSTAYGLRAADAVHLATAVVTGADRFVTNNRKDFQSDRITEIDVVYPAELPDVR